MNITKKYLRDNPHHIFVFGDNLLKKGYGGAAALRDEPNTYGFITKKAPNNGEWAFYKPEEYKEVFKNEIEILEAHIKKFPSSLFLISKIGAGLANKYNIWEEVIEPNIQVLKNYSNVKFLW